MTAGRGQSLIDRTQSVPYGEVFMPLTRPVKWLKDLFMKRWYTFINRADVEGVLRFMNYGYHSDSEIVGLSVEDEPERYPIQLYHHLASYADLHGKDLLEVGCGRGGGLSYIVRHMEPGSARGVDLNKDAIDFCRTAYPQVSFDVMDAQNLKFPDGSFDTVINVESSHRYPDFARFLREAHRVLRPAGCFLFADFRYSREIDAVFDDIRHAGFRAARSETINDEVLAALRMDSDRRIRLVERYLPPIIRGAALEFAGTPGTRLFRSLEHRTRSYICLALTK